MVGEQITIIYCGVNGLLNDVPVEKIKECEAALIHIMKKRFSESLAELAKGTLSDQTTASIKEALKEVLKNYS